MNADFGVLLAAFVVITAGAIIVVYGLGGDL